MSESLRERRRQLEQDHRRADIVRAASRMFGEKGYDGAQIAEIASAAEVSLASVYSLFEGKDEIYQEVIVSAASSIREVVQGKVDAVEDPAERLLCLIDSLFVCFEENQHLLQIYARGTHGLPWRMRQVMGDAPMRLFQSFTAWVASLAEEAKKAGCLPDVDPEAFAVSLIGAVTGTAAHWIEHTPERPLSRAAPAVRAIFERVLVRGDGS